MIGEVPAGENLFSFHWNVPPSHALLIQFKPINHHSQVKRAGLWRSSPNHPEGLAFFQRPKRWSHSVHSFFFPRQAHRSHTTSAILECSDPDLTHPGPWIYPANLNSLKTVINRGFEHIYYIKHRYGGRPCLKITADMIILLYLEGQLTHSAKDVHLCVCLNGSEDEAAQPTCEATTQAWEKQCIFPPPIWPLVPFIHLDFCLGQHWFDSAFDNSTVLATSAAVK